MGANVNLCAIVLELGQRGADSRSILQGMYFYWRMKVHALIVEFVLATHCILTQQQVKAELTV